MMQKTRKQRQSIILVIPRIIPDILFFLIFISKFFQIYAACSNFCSKILEKLKYIFDKVSSQLLGIIDRSSINLVTLADSYKFLYDTEQRAEGVVWVNVISNNILQFSRSLLTSPDYFQVCPFQGPVFIEMAKVVLFQLSCFWAVICERETPEQNMNPLTPEILALVGTAVSFLNKFRPLIEII